MRATGIGPKKHRTGMRHQIHFCLCRQVSDARDEVKNLLYHSRGIRDRLPDILRRILVRRDVCHIMIAVGGQQTTIQRTQRTHLAITNENRRQTRRFDDDRRRRKVLGRHGVAVPIRRIRPMQARLTNGKRQPSLIVLTREVHRADGVRVLDRDVDSAGRRARHQRKRNVARGWA